MAFYLVTGGAGFIGSHLADVLLARGDSVVAFDDSSTGSIDNVRHLLDHPGFQLKEGTVLDHPMVAQLTGRADVVVHLAAAVGVKLIVEQPLRSLTTNIRGSEIVIEAAHRYRRKILLASTSEIYGKNSAVGLTEESDRILGSNHVARWAYSTAKAVDEILAWAYHKERGLPSIVVRLFNTVGPRQSPAYGMVVPRLVRQALAGEPLTVFGDGEQTRCFCHVHDVVAAMLSLLDDEGAVGEVFNVGSTEEISIVSLAQRIRDVVGSESEIVLVPYEEAYESGFEYMQRRVPDTTRLRDLVGWTPKRGLAEIIAEMVIEARAERTAAAMPEL
jgi:UDP-glucose 4-epimerase